MPLLRLFEHHLDTICLLEILLFFIDCSEISHEREDSVINHTSSTCLNHLDSDLDHTRQLDHALRALDIPIITPTPR